MKVKSISAFISFVVLFSFLFPSIILAKESKTDSVVYENNISYDEQNDDNESKDNEAVENDEAQLAYLGPAVRLIVSGGKQLLKWGSKTFKKAPKSKVTNALKNFKTATYKTGGHSFKLTKNNMKHMLERHHPKYWNGTSKKKQTFYSPKLSVNDVKNIATSIAKQNKKVLAKKGGNSTFQVEGSVGGKKYVLGISKGQIKQLYPK